MNGSPGLSMKDGTEHPCQLPHMVWGQTVSLLFHSLSVCLKLLKFTFSKPTRGRPQPSTAVQRAKTVSEHRKVVTLVRRIF